MAILTYAQAIREAMCAELRRDPSVFFMGEDVAAFGGSFGVTRGMLDEFGAGRVINTPISELGGVGVAVGAAMMGMRPIVEIMFADFIATGFDQLANQASKLRYMSGGGVSVPMVVRAPAGGGTGAGAQHSQGPEAWMTNIPGLKIVAPATPRDMLGLLRQAVRDPDPVVVLEQKKLYKTEGEVPRGEFVIPLGLAEVKRAGEDITLVTYGAMVPVCLDAARQLAQRGVAAEVLDLRTLVPLDRRAIISSAKKTGRVLAVHEAPATGGFCGEIALTVVESDAFFSLKAPVRRCAGADTPSPFQAELERLVTPDASAVCRAALDLVRM